MDHPATAIGEAGSIDVKGIFVRELPGNSGNATRYGNSNDSGSQQAVQQPETADRIALQSTKPKPRNRRRNNAQQAEDDPSKRRCVSTACIACRKRKSKCDGNPTACAACSQVYGTECIYDPNSDHRRKGVYKTDPDSLKTHNSTLHTLIQAILNYAEEDVPALIREIRTCENLDLVAERVAAKEQGVHPNEDGEVEDDDDASSSSNGALAPMSTFESKLYGKVGDLRLDDGSVRYIGGTSNLIHLAQEDSTPSNRDDYAQQESPFTSWTRVANDPDLVLHLINMYFTWHYTFFTTLSKTLFYRDFSLGKPPPNTRRNTHYCTSLLVNAMLALGCHFTSHSGARENPEDSATAGDHFFREAKRLLMENDEHEKPALTTVQALALMSVREAGCGREARGWVYSGMSFRMACDMGLNLDSSHMPSNRQDDNEEDVRRITFWGCFLFDKCWSNYLGRLPQLPSSLVTASKYDVFPDEDSSPWSPYTDSGFTQANTQPARTRAVALNILKLCEISDDLMKYFYNPSDIEKSKGKAAELRKLSDIHTRLETWRRELPQEMEPKEGGLSSVLVMHMFFQLLFIHLFRPFLKHTQMTSPLPSNVSPRKLCTQAAAMISKLMRLYKRSHGLRQIPNVAVYITHSACTIHLLNLPDKNAKRDIVHGLKHLEEIAEGWLCARRTLAILSILATKWNVDLPEEGSMVLARTDDKFGSYLGEAQSPPHQRWPSEPSNLSQNHLLFPYAAPPHAPQNPTTSHVKVATMPAPKPLAITSGAMARTFSSSDHAMPPLDAKDLHARPQPSTTNTPTTSSHSGGGRGGRESRRNRTRANGSPSDMFGGIEQLLRDSNEWAYRDQVQLGTDFGNWTSMELDAATLATTNPAGAAAAAAVAAHGGLAGETNGGVGLAGPVHRPHQQRQQPVQLPENAAPPLPPPLPPPPLSHPSLPMTQLEFGDIDASVAAYQDSGISNAHTGAAAGGIMCLPVVDMAGMANSLNSTNAYSYDEAEWYQ